MTETEESNKWIVEEKTLFYKCGRCGEKWLPKKAPLSKDDMTRNPPAKCGKCNTISWNKKRTYKVRQIKNERNVK